MQLMENKYGRLGTQALYLGMRGDLTLGDMAEVAMQTATGWCLQPDLHRTLCNEVVTPAILDLGFFGYLLVPKAREATTHISENRIATGLVRSLHQVRSQVGDRIARKLPWGELDTVSEVRGPACWLPMQLTEEILSVQEILNILQSDFTQCRCPKCLSKLN